VCLSAAGSLAASGVPPSLTLDLSFAIIGIPVIFALLRFLPNVKRGNPVFLRQFVFENACELAILRARAGVSRIRHTDSHPLGSDLELVSRSPKKKRSNLVSRYTDGCSGSNSGWLVVADNDLSRAELHALFIRRTKESLRMDRVLVPIGKGELLCRRASDRQASCATSRQ